MAAELLAVERNGHRHALIEPEPGAAERPWREVEELRERLQRLEEGLAEAGVSLKSLQSQVEGYAASLSLYEQRIADLEAFKQTASMIGGWKSQTCIYNSGGVCRLWRLSREAAERLKTAVAEDNGVYRVKVAEAPWFCGLCPLYQRA
ncbi:hypothetical protein CF15_07755 [Pyrodictium occultum]|uniref:Uncharacterized protein n=1 Tax=Pyrodictium occultum TaxID=2309 RepID=A0A0V8RX16_PYROC|nr:hypothetical protein [Pyrodictium occultum]KSW12597.1 hypothetical protein CF15_07755 [Pyrodictium occultum]